MRADLDAVTSTEWLVRYAAGFAAQVEELTALDRSAGDGDFGVNNNPPLQRVAAALERAGEEPASVGRPFALLASELMRAGGTSGPLFGAFFKAIARQGEGPSMSLADLVTGVANGTEAVCRLGGAAAGDSTMVDALSPASEALAAASAAGRSLAEALSLAAAAARRGADATAALLARRGRASYVGNVALGVVDPGAAAVALFFESAPDLTTS